MRRLYTREEFTEYLGRRCARWSAREIGELWKAYQEGSAFFVGKVCVIARIVVHAEILGRHVRCALNVNPCELRSPHAVARCVIKRLGPLVSPPETVAFSSFRREGIRKLKGRYRGLTVQYYTATYHACEEVTVALAA